MRRHLVQFMHRPQLKLDLLQGKDAIEFLETLVVGDIASLKDRTGTLSVFTNEQGGIKDDSVITKVGNEKAVCIASVITLHTGHAAITVSTFLPSYVAGH